MKSIFKYDSKPSAVGVVRTSPWYIPATKLKWGLLAIKGLKKGGRVLEIGCGGGAMTRAIKYYRPDLDVYGVDFCERSLNYAKKYSDSVEFVYGDIYKLPFESGSFDAIVDFDVLEHLENLPKAVREVNRVLTPGGVFHSAIPYEGSLFNIEGWLTRLGWKSKEIYCGHVNNFKIGQPEKIIEAEGFEKIWRKFSGHLFYQLFDAVFFTIILMRGKNFQYQVEGYVSSFSSWKAKLLKVIKSVAATLFYSESFLFSFLPGLHGHLTYIKN